MTKNYTRCVYNDARLHDIEHTLTGYAIQVWYVRVQNVVYSFDSSAKHDCA